MKKRATLSLLCLAALGAQAQITLTQASFASWTPPGTDSVRDITSAVPGASTNATIDLSTATYASVYTNTIAATTSTNFPGATYSFSFSDRVNSALGNSLSWNSTQLRGITSTGMIGYGERMERQATVLLTASTDSFVVPAQTVTYSTPRTILAFPATAGSKWTSSYRYSVDFQITLGAYNLNKAPFSRVTYATMTDSVAGWGKMRVQTPAGAASAYMDVLAVRSRRTFVDSLLMNGMPAPPALLSGFGFTQGAVTDEYVVAWYRAGETRPLLRVVYTDNTYISVNYAEAHQRRLPTATGVAAAAGRQPFVVYPNPASAGSQLYLQAGDLTGTGWTYELVNAAGQQVAGAAINASAAPVGLSSALPAGLYQFQLRQNGQLVGSSSLVIGN